jgi:hypothetical protein
LALSDETGLWNKAPEITQNVINRFTRERVLVPDVFELSAAGAAQLAHAAGLVPKFTGPNQGSSWVSSQSPAAGQFVDSGSTFCIWAKRPRYMCPRWRCAPGAS